MEAEPRGLRVAPVKDPLRGEAVVFAATNRNVRSTCAHRWPARNLAAGPPDTMAAKQAGAA